MGIFLGNEENVNPPGWVKKIRNAERRTSKKIRSRKNRAQAKRAIEDPDQPNEVYPDSYEAHCWGSHAQNIGSKKRHAQRQALARFVRGKKIAKSSKRIKSIMDEWAAEEN